MKITRGASKLPEDEGEKPKTQVKEGFSAINAQSIGRFTSRAGIDYDGISPLEIAQAKNHTQVVAFLEQVISHNLAVKQLIQKIRKLDNLSHLEENKIGNNTEKKINKIVHLIKGTKFFNFGQNPLDDIPNWVNLPQKEAIVEELVQKFPVRLEHLMHAPQEKFPRIFALLLDHYR